MRLDDDMRRVVREQRLGFAATVCPDGTPNLSPKGTTIVWDDEHLVFLHVHSPRTVANLAANPAIEINVVDPIVRKGYRFKGRADVLVEGRRHAEVVEYFRRERGTDPQRIRAVVLVTVDSAEPLVSPAYDFGVSEAEVALQWRDHHLRLADLRGSGAFTGGDLDELTGLVADTWRAAAELDWSAPAGTLEWSCGRTADHAVDTVFAPAVFLASRKLDGYPEFGIATPGPEAPPARLAEALETATRLLIGVVRDAPPDARAVIWRWPQVEVRGPEDFAARGGLEMILHAHDVCAGLCIPFDPPAELCERLRQHTRSWPHWGSPGWSALTMAGPAWPDLLRASGRQTTSDT